MDETEGVMVAKRVDAERLREALAYLDGELVDVPVEDPSSVVAEAARLVAEGQPRAWCEVHDASGYDTCCWVSFAPVDEADEPCRMVEVLLVKGAEK